MNLLARLLARLRWRSRVRGVESVLVGLGNPGEEYRETRHNVGFVVVDEAATGLTRCVELVTPHALVSIGQWPGGGRVALVKPQTYMNRSGAALGEVLRASRLTPARCIVVVDDIHLPVGTLRLRRGGSDGGHNGLKSVIGVVGEEFPRMRVGIGPVPRGVPLVDFVLGRFSEVERASLMSAMPRVMGALACVMEQGIEFAMNRYNERTNAA
jgi:peptidyl-tRNA hydrolase, PTH1 family